MSKIENKNEELNLEIQKMAKIIETLENEIEMHKKSNVISYK